ncbi:MAG: hypothetical protein SCJ93_11145 [Bacillota bacterium]|nr:hypothetical protein [Bacillota bacterium]
MKKKDKTKDKNKKKVETIDKIIFAGFALIITVFILIALFAMNVLNLKTAVVERVTKELIENQENAAERYVGEDMIRQYEEMIGREFLRINKEKENLSTKEETLNQREAALTTEEEIIGQNKVKIEKLLTNINGEYQDIEELSKVVGNMSPENAAKMLTEIEDLKLVRNVIFNIKDKEAASILENMAPGLAAKIILERFNSRDELEDLLEVTEEVSEATEESDTELTEETQETQEGGEVISGGGSS